MKASSQTLFSIDEFDFAQSTPQARRAGDRTRLIIRKGSPGSRRAVAKTSSKPAAPSTLARRTSARGESENAASVPTVEQRRTATVTYRSTPKPAAAPRATPAAAVVALHEPPAAPKQTYREWLAENTKKSRWMTWFTAFYVHWLMLLMLAVIVVHGPDRYGDFVFTASMSDPEDFDTEPVELLETKIDVSETLQVEPVPVEMELNVDDTTLAPEEMTVDAVELDKGFLSSLAAQASTAEGEPASAEASGDTLPLPVPFGAVTNGSFTVWTEPENPDPGEPYKIVVQVQLPKGTEKYNLSDLEGVVVGSDGYRKPIPGSQRGNLPINSGCVRLIVHIVSADEHVRDTVFIRSKLLKEAAKLLIEF
ncbi:MAG: hypothetical protein R3C19_18900 [Planctomycetaceae bacterium]